MLSKSQLIEGIQQLNRSAQRDWLDLFDASALRRYLDHLHWMLGPRNGNNAWMRPDETRAVLTRRPMD